MMERRAVMNEMASERLLIEACRSGDREAFRRLYELHKDRVYSIVLHFSGNESSARDIVQQVFLKLFTRIGEFRSESIFSTWLHRITVNAALMRIRRRRSRPEEPIEALLPSFVEDGHSTVEFRDWGESPEVVLAREEVRTAVREAIDRLPESYRTVLVLRDIEELDTAEVAELLGISANAVKIRLHRARQALRTLLDRSSLRGDA